jgi:hypothetical protein
VTHPFHPWCGRQFEVFNVRQNWGEQRVMFFDEAQRLRSLPLAWTSVAPADPFVVLAAGRARFRLEDLCRLAQLLTALTDHSETEEER